MKMSTCIVPQQSGSGFKSIVKVPCTLVAVQSCKSTLSKEQIIDLQYNVMQHNDDITLLHWTETLQFNVENEKNKFFSCSNEPTRVFVRRLFGTKGCCKALCRVNSYGWAVHTISSVQHRLQAARTWARKCGKDAQRRRGSTHSSRTGLSSSISIQRNCRFAILCRIALS